MSRSITSQLGIGQVDGPEFSLATSSVASPARGRATAAIHAGRSPDAATGALVGGICQSTAFAHDAVGQNRGWAYSRVSNPTVDALERSLGALEEAPPAICFRSGCAAIAALFFTLLRPGDEIVVSEVVYGGTVRLLRELLADFGVIARFVDTRDAANVKQAITSRTKLVLIETPGNPTLPLVDIAAISRICRGAGVLLAVDNTFLTPIVLRPLDLGADIAVYSTTKYHDGHGASIGGAIVARDSALLERLRRTRKTLGSIQAPHEAFLTLQGLRTLELRVTRHFANAQRVAEALESRPWAKRVVYPGLASFPQRELAAELSAHGGVVSFEVEGGAAIAKSLVSKLRLVRLAEHLGSIETLITHPATMSHGDVPREQRESVGIVNGLLRLSVGLEDPADVLADLEQAYAAAKHEVALNADTIVLKFGSSVLRSDADIPAAVHEIYRFVRAGRRVVAVVSAIGNATNKLAARIGGRDSSASPTSSTGSTPSTWSAAELLATGEAASVALLSAALQRAGVPHETQDAKALSLRTEGPALDATPIGLDSNHLRAALSRVPVVVVPGFTGVDAATGRTTLLGRGGSDLTALFIAEKLDGAECVLLKDVDGVYTSDPANEPGNDAAVPERLAQVSYEDVKRLAAPLVQPKAVDVAARSGLIAEVRRVGDAHGTRIVPGPSRAAARGERAPTARTLRVAVLGAGIVGGGVIERLVAQPELFALAGVFTRTPSEARSAGAAPRHITGSFEELLASKPDVIVETIGGIEPAATWIEAALKAGISVVTANKQLIARHGVSLAKLAVRRVVALRSSAAVGGAVPLLPTLRRLRLRGERITRVEALLSGTCEHVIARLVEAHGAEAGTGSITLEDAVASAISCGLAERSADEDLDGVDVARKLAIIARALGVELDSDSLPCIDRAEWRGARIAELAQQGRPGLVATIEVTRRPDGEVDLPKRAIATVALRALRRDEPLATIPRGAVGALIQTNVSRELIWGAGAGRWPTTEAIIGDLLELARESTQKEITLPAALEGASEVGHG